MKQIQAYCKICLTQGAFEMHTGACPSTNKKCLRCGDLKHKIKECHFNRKRQGKCFYCGVPWSAAPKTHKSGEGGCNLNEITFAMVLLWREKKELKELKTVEEVWEKLGEKEGEMWFALFRKYFME